MSTGRSELTYLGLRIVPARFFARRKTGDWLRLARLSARRCLDQVSSQRSGFSLTELVVALVILLILLPTAVPLYDRYLGDAREEALKQRLREIRRALSTFRLENGRYPNWLFDGFGNNVDFMDNQKSELIQGVHSGPSAYPTVRRRYLPELPADPLTGKVDWELVILSNENVATSQSAGSYRTDTASTTRRGWTQDPTTKKWTPPPAVVNPFVPRAVPTSGVGDVRSRASGYQDL